MPTAFFRTKLRPGVTKEDYYAWVSQFVYDRVQQIPSVVGHHIYPMDGTVLASDPPSYDNIEVISSSSLEEYYYDLQNNPAAADIAQEMNKYVEVLDSVYGSPIPPGIPAAGGTEPHRPGPGKSPKRRTPQVTLKCRTGQHVIKMAFANVPTTPPGHIMGAGESAGLAFFQDGSVANLSMGFTVDFVDGKNGTHVLYTKFSFEDGSYFTIVEPGSTTASADGQTATFKSFSIAFVEGSGRFAGIEGHGTMTGTRFAPLGVDADTTLDYVLSYTLPRG